MGERVMLQATALRWCGLTVLCGVAAMLVPVHVAGQDTASRQPSETDRARHFEAQVAPLLAQRCLECHRAGSKKGGLDLSRKDAAFAGGKSGKAIVPGKADESLLWQYVDSDEMPKNRPALSSQEKQLLRQWIDAGAAWSVEVIDPSARDDRRTGGVWVQRLTVPEYIETVRSAAGVNIEEDARRLLPPDQRADGFSNTAYNLNVDLAHVEAYAKLAEIIVNRMDVAKFAAEYAKRQDLSDSNMREVISGMGKWLLRGPLEEHEVAAYLGVSRAVAKEKGNFTEAVRYIVEAMLQSPRFLYRIEKQSGDGMARRLGAYELATRLSYILWGGPPDKELMRAADGGELSKRSGVEAQVRRMLEDPRAVERSSRFISEWMDLDRLSHLRPSREMFPRWDDRLAADMRHETLAFFKEVVWEQKRPLSDLMNAQITFVTPRLAEHYGLAPSSAAGDSGALVGQAFEPARQTGKSAPRWDRVSGGLQALFTLEEGSGDVVRDLSGTGEPIHLKIPDAAAVRWSNEGLTVAAPALIVADRPPRRLIDAVKKSNAITLEAWVTPASASQAGPARIVTLSTSVLARNFTLGQEGDRFDIRLRTTSTNDSGIPSLSSSAGTAATAPVHVLYTRDAGGNAVVYIDGRESGRLKVAGDFSKWDGGFQFALANELSMDRPWLGTLHLVAVYDRALSAEDVRKNHAAGARRDGPPAPSGRVDFNPPAGTHRGARVTQDLQALYTFNERTGDTVRDTANAGEPLNLKIDNLAGTEWNTAGLTIKNPTFISTPAPPKRLIDAVKKSNAVTLEAWVTSSDVRQSGPARIVTLSSGISQRNFTLGQDGDKFDVRFRATKSDTNGLPSLAAPSGSVEMRPTHVVYTRDTAGKAKLYVDGKERAARDVGGDLSNWAAGFRLALANETSNDRPWRGTFHLVAVYSRALSPQEVERNHAAGASQSQELVRYDLASTPGRGGLLTQGSVLTVGGDEASMVTRGLFILREFLEGSVEDPPPCVDTTPVPTKPGLSQRAVAVERINNKSCSGCHAKFEPPAFALEKFDGLGAFHEKDEHGNTLREDGEIHLPGMDQPVSFRTSAELMDLLAGSNRVRRTITRKVTQFALGRPLVEADEPVVDKIHKAAQEGGGTYASLITAIVLSDLVQMSHTEGK